MTDDSPNDLNTGHFGVPAYDLDSSRWAFVRTSNGASFRQLDQWRTVIPAAIRFPSPRAPQTLGAARQVTKSIARDFPELVPATELVSELEAVSAAATAALETHDATVGQLMSFGTITPLSTRAHLARDLVALPAGEGGNILRLQLLTKEKRGWGSGAISDSLCYLDCLSWKGDAGYWNQDATAIQQVCFAQSEKPGSFLAVRLPQRVALFRPAFRQRPAAAAKSRLYDLPPSVIDVHPFHSIWTDDTGNTPHADVAFNPHYHRQFAIIDQKSNWSVWDIDGTRRGYVVKRAASGIMINTENDNEEQAEDLQSRKEDGWARTMWVGDANTLLVCNRKRIDLIDLRQPSRPLNVPQVLDERSVKHSYQPWILDVKRHPLLDEKQFFVLTSTRLYLFSATFDEQRGNFDDTDASIVLSWTHFRGTQDVTLQLFTQSISDEETAVFIYSRLNALITVYRLVDQTSTGAPYRTFGPTMLRLDNFDNAHSAKLILNLNIARIHLKIPTGDSRGVGDDYHDRDVHFYQLSAILDDLSVAQTTICTLGHDSTDSSLENIEPTSWTTAIKPVAFRSNAVVDRDEDDFVEPGGSTNFKEPLLKTAFPQLKQYKKEDPHISRGMFNFTSLYEVIGSNNPSSLHHAGTLSESIDIVALVEEIKWRLDREENVDPFTLGTLLEYAEAIVTVEDIDDASTKLQGLSSTDAYVSSLEPRRIASDLVLGFGGEAPQEPSSLSYVYDLVLQNWLASLPENIPARVRQSKERMVRRLATRLLLASTRIRHSNDGKNLPATQSDPSQHLAVSHSPPPHYSSQSDRHSQSSLPSDPISLDAPPISKASLSNPLARLSKHLHMTNITPPEVPPSIDQVLSHWQLEADPTTYDWEATERAFEEELELEQEGVPKKRERARRKKERQAKRQKRENQLFTGRVETGKVESQPQLLRSSPGPAPPAISSQVLAPNESQPFVVQSQVEPGKHGGRPIKKKKVKSRMSGF